MNRPQRNNNPGNMSTIRNWWRGQVELDGKLAVFANPFWGWRAILIDMQSSLSRNPQTTIREYIEEYAPPSENDTKAYLSYVVKNTTIGWQQVPATPDSPLSEVDVPSFLKAIATMEGWYAKP